jgi:hypothetical protein
MPRRAIYARLCCDRWLLAPDYFFKVRPNAGTVKVQNVKHKESENFCLRISGAVNAGGG